MLRALARHVRDGGIIAFHEIAWVGIKSSPRIALYDQCREWGEQTLQRHGTEAQMGMKLHAAYVDAGLAAPSLRYRSLIAAGANAGAVVHLMTDVIATLLPEMQRLGVAEAREVGIETLAERILADVAARDAVLIGFGQVGAWSRA